MTTKNTQHVTTTYGDNLEARTLLLRDAGGPAAGRRRGRPAGGGGGGGIEVATCWEVCTSSCKCPMFNLRVVIAGNWWCVYWEVLPPGKLNKGAAPYLTWQMPASIWKEFFCRDGAFGVDHALAP